MVAGVYLLFIAGHNSFIQIGDGYRQGYFWIAELKHNLEAFAAGEGYELWSWSRGMGAESGLPTDPFNIIAALFPVGYLELGYTVAVLLRIYCSGLAFILFARELDMSQNKCLLGSICYAFSGWVVGVGLVQSNFLINTVLFPLLILGVEKIYKKKSPIMFILVVAYYLIRNVVFAYMAAIMVIIYIFVRYFAYCGDEFKCIEYAKKIGMFIFYGIIGVIISLVVLLPYTLALSEASTEAASTTNELLFSTNEYSQMFTKILLGRFDGGGNYAYLGISAFLIMLIPIGFRRFSIKKTPEIMVVVCFIMYLLPFFWRMFNGFSYATGRWTFMFLFFIVWCAVSNLEMEYLREKANILIMSVTWILMTALTLGMQGAGFIELTNRPLAFISMNLAGAAAALIIIMIKPKQTQVGKSRYVLVGIVVLCTIICTWNLNFLGNIDMFLKNNEINSQLEKSTQRVGSELEDDDFYRIDQVDGIIVNKVTTKPANETLWWDTNSIYTYESKVPAKYLEYNKLVGNNCGYTERVAVFSNDNRMGLDFLAGVRYFLGDDVNEEKPSSQYAGYGFTYDSTIDGVDILKNKYNAGLGFVYEKYIRESEFKKLSRLEREQALLQGAVVPDKSAATLGKINELSVMDIEKNIHNIGYKVIATDGVIINDGQIVAEKADATFTLKTDKVTNSQLILSFDGLILQSPTRPAGGAFELYCKNEFVTKKAYNKLGNQGLDDIADYDINLGYYDNYSGTITVTLSEAGTYNYERMYLSGMGAGLYDKYVKRLNENRYVVTDYNGRSVKGSVDAKQDGILYLSVLSDKSWEIYIDGDKAENVSQVNIAFTGVEISAGYHEIELKYNYKMLKLGAITSVLGILLMVVAALISNHRKKSNRRCNED